MLCMSTTTKIVRRASLPVSERDEADLATLRRSMAHRIALGRITHRIVTDDLSEAAFLHAPCQARGRDDGIVGFVRRPVQ